MLHPRSHNLPIDLYLPILDHIQDKNDLLSLCHVSSDWYATASLKLYSCVEGLSRQTKRQLFFRTMCQNTHLALLVKEYNMEILQPLSLEAEEWDSIRTGLHAMERLQTFTIHSSHSDYIALLMVDCPFRLRRLCWISYGGSEENVLRVLSQQTDLVELDLAFNQATLLSSIMPASTCPHLMTLHGGRTVIEAFLPNHRITTLSWSPEFDESHEPLYDLHDSLCHLRVLCLGGKWLRPRLGSIAQHLCSLEVLELTYIWPNEKSCIGTLTRLRCLILSKYEPPPSHPLALESRSSVVDQFFSSNSTLQTIFVELPRDRNDKELYQQWARSAQNHTIVLGDEVFKWTPIRLRGFWG